MSEGSEQAFPNSANGAYKGMTLKQYYIGQILMNLSDWTYWYKDTDRLVNALDAFSEAAIQAGKEKENS